MAASTTSMAQIGCGIETENKRAEVERFYCIVDGKPYMSYKIHPEYNTNDK